MRPVSPAQPQFTLREKQLLELLPTGMSKRRMAKELNISYDTVKTGMRVLYRKLRVGNRSQAAVWALQYREQWSEVRP